MKKKFGMYLLDEGVINLEDINEALKIQKRMGLMFGETLVQMGCINNDDMIFHLGKFLGVKTAKLSDVTLLHNFIIKIPKKIALQHQITPVKFKDEDDLYIAFYKTANHSIFENLKRVLKTSFHPLLMSERDSVSLFKQAYPQELKQEEVTEIDTDLGNLDETIELVDNIIIKAISLEASDIHIEPEIEHLRVRFRIDGVLRTVELLPIEVAESVILRIKVLSDMNIADKRSPQDGGFKFDKTEEIGVSINLRVSALPCSLGEKVVIRLLPTEEKILTIEELGMSKEMTKDFKSMLELPYGIIFVTGPTGSGKTNTLYASINFLRSDEVNITTVEDPIELDISGINQTQVSRGNSFDFSKALKAMLRQDPNIIMVGEVRDGQTAGLALEAALTGHLVLSTLHTNDATSVFGRLIDMGCETFLVTSSIRAVLAQRLVRVLCPGCKEAYTPDNAELMLLGIDKEKDTVFYRERGCNSCNNSGYRGRTGIFELFILNPEIQSNVNKTLDMSMIRNMAIQNGMKTLREDGIRKLKEGITSTTEILKATSEW
ncbi:pilus assembly protein, ATPase/type II secretion system protein E [Gottschalkia acidurici 9a]|uniref:Pilus assembly protein, ATPase/type II secretion system protein E n=1 Tax=Gottschalkia acidurici (strain ATCC 7906 / DSM 604 / BCRC 14475 / CIP 104303 / KCTC 5404 / NCIMB 10678 / 9a) TaxID=1128398 RepID=K0AZS6_GOTA9|nr:GspE/PulE family protein [Gottschalkia acidurici]AFS78287.1 pilus assembly protein, ATPase/type II secretion system protein E [Gottschalkia acidurici 9a]